MKTYARLAQLLQARQNCIKSGNSEWQEKHEERIMSIFKNTFPHGSGIDSSYLIDFERSNGEKIVFSFSFHHMNDVGYYDGWTTHTVTVTPSLSFGFNLKISGRNKNDIKEYLYDQMHGALHDKTEE
jgi:hypothetical protein